MATVEQRLTDLEDRVTTIEDTDAPLTLIRHVWTSALAPAGTFIAGAAKMLAPYAVTAIVTLMLVGHLAIPGCPGPVPPTPTPTPPAPPVPPAPIPDAGFRVLMLYETQDLGKYPPAQESVLFSKSIRDYLNAKCVVGADGKTKEWRIFDKDVDASAEAKWLGDTMQRHPASLPWIVISDGKTGFEGPLPASVADTLTLLQKYGG